MPITLLDIILLVVMLISGLLAMIRGFMREILSIAAWVVAALATLYAYPQAPAARQAIFQQRHRRDRRRRSAACSCCTLLIVSIITVRISDMVLDSRVGALDRTLGFLFGLGARAGHRGRGLPVLRLAGARPQPAGMGARTPNRRWCCKGTGEWLMAMLPEDPESTILKRLKKHRSRTIRTPRTRRPASVPMPDRRRRRLAARAGYERRPDRHAQLIDATDEPWR